MGLMKLQMAERCHCGQIYHCLFAGMCSNTVEVCWTSGSRYWAATLWFIPTETKCHWESNKTQDGAVGQTRRGSDICDFCSSLRLSAVAPRLKNPPAIFSPIRYIRKEEPRMPIPSQQMTTATRNTDSPQPIISAWIQLHAEIFYCVTVKIASISKWVKCWGPAFSIDSPKWTVDMYANMEHAIHYSLQEGAWECEE